MAARGLEHRQLPRSARIVAPQNVQIGVLAAKLDVAVASAMPLIEQLGDFDALAVKGASTR